MTAKDGSGLCPQLKASGLAAQSTMAGNNRHALSLTSLQMLQLWGILSVSTSGAKKAGRLWCAAEDHWRVQTDLHVQLIIKSAV